MLQFGASFSSSASDPTSGRRAFKRQFEAALKGVLLVYPKLDVDVTEQFFVIRPSPTHIPIKGKQAQLW